MKVLFHEDFGDFVALTTDVETRLGVGNAYALQVEVLNGSIYILLSHDAVDACIDSSTGTIFCTMMRGLLIVALNGVSTVQKYIYIRP